MGTGLNITILSPAVREKVSVQWQGNIRIGSRRQVSFAVAVDCRQRTGRDFGYGFCAPVQLSHHCRYWRPARTVHPRVEKWKWKWSVSRRDRAQQLSMLQSGGQGYSVSLSI